MQKILVIALVLIFSVQSFDFFLTSPEQNFYLGSTTATCMEVASDESMALVGFQDGLVEAYTMDGKFIRNFTKSTHSIVQILWLPNYGPLTLDSSGYLYLYYANGSGIAFSVLNSVTGLIGMTLTTVGQVSHVGIIFNNRVDEYTLDVPKQSITTSRTYTVTGASILTAYYSTGYQFLFVGLNNQTLFYYNCSNGQLAAYYNLKTANIVQMQNYGNNYIFLDSDSGISQFDTSGNINGMVTSNKPSGLISTCPKNLNVVFAFKGQSLLAIYEGSDYGQQLSYMHNSARAISCTQSHLVSLDNSNYIAFNSYTNIDSKILGWVIAVIVISIVLFIALVVTIIYCICKRRRQSLLNQSDYGKELNSSRR